MPQTASPDTSVNSAVAKREVLRLGQAVLAVVVILIGGLIAINQWLLQPRLFGRLEISVVDQTVNRPFVGVAVELSDATGSMLATGRSDEKGYYGQGRMPEGRHRLRISAPGYQAVERWFEVSAGETTRLTIGLMMAEPPPPPAPPRAWSPAAPMPAAPPPPPVEAPSASVESSALVPPPATVENTAAAPATGDVTVATPAQ